MPDRNLYEAWKRRRAEIPVPGDFADRVMASLQHPENTPRQRHFIRLLRGLIRSPAFQVGVCSLAGIAGLLRVLQVVAFFLTDQPSR